MRKMEEFLQTNGIDSISFVHNSCAQIGNTAVCGTRGWFADDSDRKILLREIGRLRTSLECARKAGLEPVVFLHYPPLYADFKCDEIIDLLTEYGVKKCYYGHIHGYSVGRAKIGEFFGIRFRLVSCDSTCFTPILVV